MTILATKIPTLRRLQKLIALTAFVVAACGSGPFATESTALSFIPPPDTALGGDGLPILTPDIPITRRPVPVEGQFSLAANGCWTADLGDHDNSRLVIFPVGYDKPADNGAAMRSPDGVLVVDGMAFDGFGYVTPTSTLPGYPDGYWGNHIAFCDPEALEVLILSDIQPAFEPDEMSPEVLVALLTNADLTESWPCGIGFAISDPSQHVAVQIYVNDADIATESPVTFPSLGWDANVVIGNHLMSNHCNDAVESWTATREETGRWQIVGGVLHFAPRVNDPCGGSNTVTGILRDGVVDTPTGLVALPDLHIVNRAFGCFAG